LVFPLNKEIRIWKKREGSVKETIWLTEGIKIYRELIKNNPNSNEYKSDLAKLLIRSGTDEKLKYMNLMNAKQIFEEVLGLFPHDAEALYRLGHIYYEVHDYEKSIDYFIKSVELPVSEIRAFRAYTTISKAYFHLGEEGEANLFLQKAIEMDRERNFTSDINEVKSLITQEGRNKMLVRYPDGMNQLISVEDAEKLRFETDDNGDAELDLSHLHPVFIGPEDAARLERKEAEILCYLIERDKRFVSKDELLNVWEESEWPEPNTIKSYISKIRSKVRDCLPEDTNEIITSERGKGYRWTCPIHTKIIKHL
jgi:tetratricopeptide (TPR) repeat protein